MSEESKEESKPASVDTTAGGAEDPVDARTPGLEDSVAASPGGTEDHPDLHAATTTLESARPPEMSSRETAGAHDGDHQGHGPAGHGSDHGHGHVSPMWLLLGVLGALVVLTVLTVAVTAVDLGSQGNLIVAMVIATIKAILVMGFFMHLIWDSRFNLIAFTSSFLFVILFLSMSVLDRNEYRPTVQAFEADAAAKK